MVLSKRERYIIAAAVISIVVFAGDRYILTPFTKSRDEAAAKKQNLVTEMERAANLFARRRQMDKKWKEMVAAGLKNNATEAEGQVLHAVRNWAGESRLTLSSVRPEHVAGRTELREIVFKADGTASLAAIAYFMWSIETAPFPLKVRDLQIDSKSESADEVSFQLRISTIHFEPKQEQPKAAKPQNPSGGSL